MFNRKHRKVRYAKCPYCGKSPVISEGRSITDKNELVMHYKCPKNHLPPATRHIQTEHWNFGFSQSARC